VLLKKNKPMIAIKSISCGFITALVLLLGTSDQAMAQASGPEILDTGTLQEQYDFVQQRTRIYEGFRAVREDMFQKLKQNSLDSLRQAHRETRSYQEQLSDANTQIEELDNRLETTTDERDQAIREKDSLYFLGIPMHKTFYNVLLWSIIAGLLAFALIMLVMFKRAHRITRQTQKDLNELQDEYEDYRKTSRERFEQQSIDHFNEIRKLKGI
jgi:uncharacterized membrane-anchored protein YhcB (DUF1043 family)